MAEARELSPPARSSSTGRQPTLSRWLSMAQDAALVVVSALFSYFHAHRVIAEGNYTSLFFAIEQAVLIGIYLGRRRSTVSSTRPVDWLTATIGCWLALALRPSDEGVGPATVSGTAIQMAGLALTTLAFISLGKSFGIVAANRGLKVNGPYRLVRHPIYLSHAITQTGFLVANFQTINVAIPAVVWICQLLRIRAEERVLTETADYTAYRQRVRWRLIPGIY